MATKILFADDDPLMHLLYKHHVEGAGYQWLGVSNGREALAAAAEEAPQVAILDVMMPEMDGLSAVLELKKAAATRGIPVILITSNPKYYLHRREFAEAGAAVFLTKPFGPAQLLEAVRGLVGAS